MGNFQAGPRRKSRFTPRLRAWLAILVLVGVCFILGRAVWSLYQKNDLARANKESTLRRLADLQSRQKRMEAKLAKISSVAGMEEEIRRALPVAKDGEHVITIIDARDVATTATDVPTSSPAKAGLWAALIRLVTSDK